MALVSALQSHEGLRHFLRLPAQIPAAQQGAWGAAFQGAFAALADTVGDDTGVTRAGFRAFCNSLLCRC